MKNFKSVVAFFFLFFLHGTSIKNEQQGISANYFIAETKPNYYANIIN
jgi:hypothetical protein